MLFQAAGMRRAVRSKKEARAIAGRGLDKRLPVHLTLEDRQAVPVRPDASLEYCVAVIEQVLRCDRRRNGPLCVAYVLDAVLGGQVFKHDTQLRVRVTQRLHDAIDENRFPIEHIDRWVSHFPVDQQRRPNTLHPLDDRAALSKQIGHAGI